MRRQRLWSSSRPRGPAESVRSNNAFTPITLATSATRTLGYRSVAGCRQPSAHPSTRRERWRRSGNPPTVRRPPRLERLVELCPHACDCRAAPTGATVDRALKVSTSSTPAGSRRDPRQVIKRQSPSSCPSTRNSARGPGDLVRWAKGTRFRTTSPPHRSPREPRGASSRIRSDETRACRASPPWRATGHALIVVSNTGSCPPEGPCCTPAADPSTSSSAPSDGR